jgi:hypothetical protein
MQGVQISMIDKLNEEKLDKVFGGLTYNNSVDGPWGVFSHKDNKLLATFPIGKSNEAFQFAREYKGDADMVNMTKYPNWPNR